MTLSKQLRELAGTYKREEQSLLSTEELAELVYVNLPTILTALELQERLDKPETVEVPDYVSDEVKGCLAIRNPIHAAVFMAMRKHGMTNMCDADDHMIPYPLVDLMSNPAPSDISTGEWEMLVLTDEIVDAINALKGGAQ